MPSGSADRDQYRVQNRAYHGREVNTEAGRSGTDQGSQGPGFCRWMGFAVGNLLAAVAVLREIETFHVCFEDDTWRIDVDIATEGFELEEHLEYDASSARSIVLAALWIGLLVEVGSALMLSYLYCSPLGIASVHKIPPDDLRSKVGSIILFVMAPLSWSIVYLLGGVASVLFSLNPPCEGQDREWLKWYLLASGILMTIAAVIFFVITMTICAPFSCGSPTRCTDGCCARARENIHRHVLSYGLYLELFWQLQGAMWAYRMGVFEEDELIVVSALSFVGEHLASYASVAPIVVALVASRV